MDGLSAHRLCTHDSVDKNVIQNYDQERIDDEEHDLFPTEISSVEESDIGFGETHRPGTDGICDKEIPTII